MSGDVRPFVVTLVHGTFARGAAWANDAEALLRRRLHEAFGDAVRIRAFNWSGGNSHQARWRGAAELGADQAAVTEAQPGLPRFVVAHSHGGNVALYASHDEASASGLAGIVTMGTPFIDCQPRSIEAGMVLLRWALPVTALVLGTFLFAMLGLLAYLAAGFFWPHASEDAYFWGLLIGGVYGVSLPVGMWSWVHRRMPRLQTWATVKRDALMKQLQLPVPPAPMLCIHVAGDEAGMWLSLTRFVAEMPYAVWRRATLVVLLVVFTALTYVSVLPGIEGSGPVATHLTAGMIALLLTGAGLLMYGVYWQFAMAGVPLLVRAHRGAYGGEGLFHNWLLRIGTTTVPACADGQVHEYACVVPRGVPGFKHSWMYGDEKVIDDIVQWMRIRLHALDAATDGRRAAGFETVRATRR